MARILILCVVLLSICTMCSGTSDMSMKDMCENHKQHGRCDKEGIKKQCAAVCGGGGGGEAQPHALSAPAPAAPPASEETTKTTQKPTSKQTQKPNPSGAKKNCDKRSPCVSMEEANAAFLKRCQASSLKPTCHPHCRYDEDTNTMKKDFLGGPCPLNQLRVYLTAASNSKDNTACCAETGVMSQKKTGLCGCFCNPTGQVWPQKGEASKYAPCVGVLTGIMQCHYYAEGAD